MKHKDIIEKMTLKEKIELCSGRDFWHTKGLEQHGIPEITMSDGPHGLRKQESEADMLGINKSLPATSFPTAAATGCSWDVDLLGRIGQAIAKEAALNGVGVILGPGVCIKRNPLCGRNFEYFSEDPFLSGILGASYIREAQKTGVGTSLKHFAFNNQEYKRFSSNSIMDARTMREIYLPAFEIAVKEGKPQTVMAAYNKFNGTYCSDSKLLLTDILRSEWGFDGMVVTDWGAMHDRIQGFIAGCDLSMPGGSAYMEKEALLAVGEGKLNEEHIDRCVDRVIDMALNVSKALAERQNYDKEKHHELARIAAEQSAVLLKNKDSILPIDEGDSIGLIGYMAKEIRYQGAGSSHINPTKLTNVTDVLPTAPFAAGCDREGNTTEQLLKEAVDLARKVKIPIVFAGLTDNLESEGFDRKDLKMPIGHIKMINAVAEVNPNTVVVLMCGGVVEIPWIEQVGALLYMALPGQAGGQAIVNLLFGKAVPCGKLTETWPIAYEDCITASYYGIKDAHYREGIYVGYRYFDKTETPVRFPFGFGLSYTEFRYSNLCLEHKNGDDDYEYIATFDVENVGKREGAEIVQLYIAPPHDGIHRPIRELKGFAKLSLMPGEKKKVVLQLDQRSFTVWKDCWIVPGGKYSIQIGPNSRNFMLEAELTLSGEELPIPIWQKGSWYEIPNGVPSQQDWEKVLGYQINENKLRKGQFTMENSVMEMKDFSWVMKILYKFIERSVAKGFDGKVDYTNRDFKLMMNSSVDGSLSCMKINGGVSSYMFEGMLEMANGHWLRGIQYMLRK